MTHLKTYLQDVKVQIMLVKPQSCGMPNLQKNGWNPYLSVMVGWVL